MIYHIFFDIWKWRMQYEVWMQLVANVSFPKECANLLARVETATVKKLQPSK
jgi:hypothetical protein